MNPSPDKSAASASTIRVTRKDVDANGPYYQLQITLSDGQQVDVRYHTSSSANEGGTNNATGSATGSQASGTMGGSANAGTQGGDSVPVEMRDPAKTSPEEAKKVEIDPRALQAAIDQFEREHALGALEKEKEPDRQQEVERSLRLGRERQMPASGQNNFFSLDLSFLRGTGVCLGTPTQEFEYNLAHAGVGALNPCQGLDMGTSPVQEIPAHVKSIAVMALGRTPVAGSAGFDMPNGFLPGMDFANRNVIPPTRMPAQVRMPAFA